MNWTIFALNEIQRVAALFAEEYTRGTDALILGSVYARRAFARHQVV